MGTDIRDIKGPLAFHYGTLFFLILILAAATIVLIFFAMAVVKKGRNSTAVSQTAHDGALAALGELRAKGYLGNGRVREYYIELSDIMRGYVETRLAFTASCMTTEELRVALSDSFVLSAGQKRLLGGFLADCDMVKFAGYLPERSEAERNLQLAVLFIDETKETEFRDGKEASG